MPPDPPRAGGLMPTSCPANCQLLATPLHGVAGNLETISLTLLVHFSMWLDFPVSRQKHLVKLHSNKLYYLMRGNRYQWWYWQPEMCS